MTILEARAILEKSDNLKPVTKNGITYNNFLGDFYKELPDSYGFAVYPYTSNSPFDPLWAFAYFVLKENGGIVESSVPIPEEDLKKIDKK